MPSLAEALSDGSGKPPKIPNDVYKFRIKDCKFQKSKAGNPMFVMDCELFGNPPVQCEQGQEPIDINGLSANHWITLIPENLRRGLAALHKSAGLPLDIALEDILAKPNTDFYKGVKFTARAYSEAQEQKNEVTGQFLKDPNTGEKLVYYALTIKEIF